MEKRFRNKIIIIIIIINISCATWCEGTAQLLSVTELKLHLFDFFFIVAETIN